jgi:hypothetical protein
MNEPMPPRRAELLLEALGGDTLLRELVLGDLAEEFAIRVRWDGPRAARRWYYRESVRIAPFLLRDWWGRLRPKDLGSLAAAALLSCVFLMGFEWILQVAVNGIVGAGGPHGSFAFLQRLSPAVAGLMLLWTAVDGVTGGYVAARIGRRAPLQSAFALGVGMVGLMALERDHPAPSWFQAANAATLLAAVLVGAGLRVCSATPRTVSSSAEPFRSDVT